MVSSTAVESILRCIRQLVPGEQPSQNSMEAVVRKFAFIEKDDDEVPFLIIGDMIEDLMDMWYGLSQYKPMRKLRWRPHLFIPIF